MGVFIPSIKTVYETWLLLKVTIEITFYNE